MKIKNTSIVAGLLTFLFCLLLAGSVGATNYTLTLVAQGSGTVSKNPTNSPYPSGVTVTITATPNAGWYFANWTGDINNTTNPLNVTMNSNMVITGNFLAYPTYSVALVTNGQGGIALSPSGGSYLSNTVVTATATPAAGWEFVAWFGATNSSANPVSFAVNTNVALTGYFVQLPAFDVQPVNVTNKAGSTVSFISHAVGTAPLGYTWYFSGGTLANATGATLSLTNVATSQAGNYWVVATNNYGSATSLVVSLTLTNPVGPTNVANSPDQGSLQAAIAQGGWIGIGFSGTITLTNTINITNNVVLDGTGVAATISGGNAVQIFNVAPGASLTISNLTLANGTNATGAGIESDMGAVVLVGCLLTNNQATSGGAVFNNGGTLTLFGSAFLNNIAAGNGCSGGAVYQASGFMVISNCIFSFNSSTNMAGGYSSAGGGALALSGGNITIARSHFFENKVSGIGPAWINSGCSVYGGAISSTANLNVSESSFAGNQAIADNRVNLRSPGSGSGFGGAIYNAGTAVLNRCSIYSNSVQGGYTYPYVNSGSEGGLGYGGGIYNSSQFTATNCTIALNSTISGAAGGFGAPEGTSGPALGGGVYNGASATFDAMNLTIASNICSSPASTYSTSGIAAGAQIANTNGILRVHNTLIAYPGANSDAYGPITDGGYNICDDGSAALFGGSSYNYTDPQLAALAANGGPTLTMALQATSPAIDNGDPNGAPTTDQRGYLRPASGAPDMGAYEYGALPLTAPTLAISAGGTNLLVSFTAYPSSTYYLQYSTNLANWSVLSTNGPFVSQTNITQTIGKQSFNHCYFRLLMQ